MNSPEVDSETMGSLKMNEKKEINNSRNCIDGEHIFVNKKSKIACDIMFH